MAMIASNGIARRCCPCVVEEVVVVAAAVAAAAAAAAGVGVWAGLEISELEDERRSVVALEEPSAFPGPEELAAWTCEAE